MSDNKRPKSVDLSQFEGSDLPDNWSTLCPGKTAPYSVNITSMIADLLATRAERDGLRKLLKRWLDTDDGTLTLFPDEEKEARALLNSMNA